jgi:predicted ATPase/transcriptional regulator with XRE-family HTH domain
VAAFGHVLRQTRRAADLTQEELAERAGISTRTISDLERGVYPTARKDTARLLADALGLGGADRETFVLTAAGRESPPAAGAARSHVVPAPGRPLLGRAILVDQVLTAVDSGARLVTLTGPGGVGKTSVAAEVAQRQAQRRPAGATFVRLDTVTDPALLIPTIARELGVHDSAATDPVTAVVTALSARRGLLVLDNLEQLVDAAAGLVPILEGCPEVTLLVTSRIPLRLRAEQVLEVPPLPVPPLGGRDDVGGFPSVELLVDRIRAGDPAWTPDPAQLASLAAVCRRLDGLPLALELAAPRIRMLGAQGLLDRPEGGLALLTRGPRDAPPRHRTLSDALEWSHQLLDADARIVFRRLAVFSGGFTVEAAEAVCREPGERLDVLDALTTLIEASLVRQGEGTPPRLTMMQTVLEYAAQQLPAEERDAAERRHGEYSVASLDGVDEGLLGPGQLRWLALLDLERDNLAAAVDRAVDRSETLTALRLVASLARFWRMRGDSRAGLRRARRALELPGGDPVLRGQATYGAGNLALALADFATARELLVQAASLFEAAGAASAMGWALNSLGVLAMDQGDLGESASWLERCLEVAGDDQQLAVWARHNLAVAVRKTQPQRAFDVLTEILAYDEASGDDNSRAVTLNNLGSVCHLLGRYADAAAHHREAVRLADRTGDVFHLVGLVEDLAVTLMGLGEDGRAAALFGLAETVRESTAHGARENDAERHAARDELFARGDPGIEAARRHGRRTPPERVLDLIE